MPLYGQNTDSGSTTAVSLNAQAAAGAGAAVPVQGYRRVSCQTSGTFAATVTFQHSFDGVTNWYNIAMVDGTSTTSARAISTTGLNTFHLPPEVSTGFVRGNVTAYTSGNVTLTYHLTP